MSVELVDSWEPTGNSQMTTNRVLTPLSICNCFKGTRQLAGKCHRLVFFCFAFCGIVILKLVELNCGCGKQVDILKDLLF